MLATLVDARELSVYISGTYPVRSTLLLFSLYTPVGIVTVIPVSGKTIVIGLLEYCAPAVDVPITIVLLILAFVCIKQEYFGELPWIAAMVGFPWSAYGVSQMYYYKKSMAENTKDGIKYDTVM